MPNNSLEMKGSGEYRNALRKTFNYARF